ncbi:MAG: DUF2147 domain-containing protein [Rhodomicrobium sp.]|nr:DUF2147 domain-containing protein [Rhodomicrobium sp.]
MFKKVTLTAAILTLGCALMPAQAAEMKDMIGKWKWTDFTVEVKECTTNPSGAGICGTVIDGPKNKGMEMIRSKLEKQGDNFVGKIAHPASGDIYNTKLSFKGTDVWSMDGCTDKNVCAKGDFTRVK